MFINLRRSLLSLSLRNAYQREELGCRSTWYIDPDATRPACLGSCREARHVGLLVGQAHEVSTHAVKGVRGLGWEGDRVGG